MAVYGLPIWSKNREIIYFRDADVRLLILLSVPE